MPKAEIPPYNITGTSPKTLFHFFGVKKEQLLLSSGILEYFSSRYYQTCKSAVVIAKIILHYIAGMVPAAVVETPPSDFD